MPTETQTFEVNAMLERYAKLVQTSKTLNELMFSDYISYTEKRALRPIRDRVEGQANDLHTELATRLWGTT